MRAASRARSVAPFGWRAHGLSHAGLLLLVSSLAACGHTPTGPTTFSLSCPASFDTKSPDGRPMVVTYSPPLPLGGTPPINVSCTPVSGSVFPVKATTVQCTATDDARRTASCSFTVTVVAPPYLKYTRHLAFGDSMTEGQDGLPVPAGSTSRYVPLVVRPEIAYPTRLQEWMVARYTAQTTQVINRGKGGESAVDGAKRLPTDLTTYRPEVVLLLEGANDIYGGNPAAISPASVALRAMVREAKARGLPAYLATLPPQRQGGYRAGGYALVVPLNTEIKKIATEEGAVLVDVYTAFNGDLTLIGPDGLHPNEAGYLRMAEAFEVRIRETLEIPFPGVAAAVPGGLAVPGPGAGIQ